MTIKTNYEHLARLVVVRVVEGAVMSTGCYYSDDMAVYHKKLTCTWMLDSSLTDVGEAI
jgi:hypothetical protein